MDWVDIENRIIEHFTNSDRKKTITDLMVFPYFFEEWFTAECLVTLKNYLRTGKIWVNENFRNFVKPDIVLEFDKETFVLEIKHLATGNQNCQSRWNGAKPSTVAKDVEKLLNGDKKVVKKIIAFYGPAWEKRHGDNTSCYQKKKWCLKCSIDDLKDTVISTYRYELKDPRKCQIVPESNGNGGFYALIFSID